MLAGATVRAVEGNTLVLSHESAPLAKRLSEQRNADVIAEALKDALGVDWRVRCEAGRLDNGGGAGSTGRLRPGPSSDRLAGWSRRRPRRPKPPLMTNRTSGPRKKACLPRPIRTTRRPRAAIPKKPRWNSCRASWARVASTTLSAAPAQRGREIDHKSPKDWKTSQMRRCDCGPPRPAGVAGPAALRSRPFRARPDEEPRARLQAVRGGSAGLHRSAVPLHDSVLALAMILHRYDLAAENDYRLTFSESITLKPRGFRLGLKRRAASSRVQPVDVQFNRLSA